MEVLQRSRNSLRGEPSVETHAEEEPEAPNKSASGRAKNRHVDLVPGDALQACSNVHPSPKKSPPGTTTSADMNADLELKPPILGLSGARLCQLVLNRNSVLDSIHCARELGQHAVPGSVGHPGLRAR